jgi:hypothetical protein
MGIIRNCSLVCDGSDYTSEMPSPAEGKSLLGDSVLLEYDTLSMECSDPGVLERRDPITPLTLLYRSEILKTPE